GDVGLLVDALLDGHLAVLELHPPIAAALAGQVVLIDGVDVLRGLGDEPLVELREVLFTGGHGCNHRRPPKNRTCSTGVLLRLGARVKRGFPQRAESARDRAVTRKKYPPYRVDPSLVRGAGGCTWRHGDDRRESRRR